MYLPVSQLAVFLHTSVDCLNYIFILYQANAETGPKLREEFARICFEVLLQFSLLHEEQMQQQQGSTKPLMNNTSPVTNQLAITSLLDRFHKILANFVQDGKNCGQSPLPR